MIEISHGGRSISVIAGESSLKIGDLLSKASLISEESMAQIRLLDASKVFGPDHIESAFQKASRAFEEKENLSDSIVTETMLYMSGGRQIQDAVRIIGIQENTKSIVVITDIDGRPRDEIAKKLSMIEDDSIITDIRRKDISQFGITDIELTTVQDDKKLDLVLEKVASVDIRKK